MKMRVLPLLVLLASACTHGGADVPAPKSPVALHGAAQIIIKFRDPHLDPSQSNFLEEISRDAGAALVHVRPMSGGAHVLRPEKKVDGAEFDRIIARLRKRQDIEYVQPDRLMRHMNGATQ